MGDQDQIDHQWIGVARIREAGIGVTGKELVVTAIDENHLAFRGLQNETIALLHVHHRQPQQARVAQPGLGPDEAFVDFSACAEDFDTHTTAFGREHVAAVPLTAIGTAEIYDVIIKISHERPRHWTGTAYGSILSYSIDNSIGFAPNPVVEGRHNWLPDFTATDPLRRSCPVAGIKDGR